MGPILTILPGVGQITLTFSNPESAENARLFASVHSDGTGKRVALFRYDRSELIEELS